MRGPVALLFVALGTGCGPATEIKGSLAVDETSDQSAASPADGGADRRDAGVIDDGHCPLPTLASLSERFFVPSCGAASCHAAAEPALGLDLTLSGAALRARLLEPSRQSLQSLPLVTPGQYGASYLYLKVFLETPVVGAQMPPDAPAERCAVEALRTWIQDGAPE